MSIRDPQSELPSGVRGGSDVWDQQQASVILNDDYFVSIPLTGTQSDNFNDNSIDATKWTNGSPARITEVSTQLQVSTVTAAGYYGIRVAQFQSLYSSSASIKLVNAGNQALTSLEVYPIQIYGSAGLDAVGFFITNNALYFFKKVSGSVTYVASSITYNSVNHLYFKIRETSGITYWETSTDGLTWTVRASTANPIDYSEIKPDIVVGTYAVEASGTTVIYDDYNIVPVSGGYTLSADPATFNITTQPASLRRQLRLSCQVSTFSIATVAALLLFVHRLLATVASFTIATIPAGLPVARKMIATVRTYSIATVSAQALVTRRISTTAATYTLAPQNAQFARVRVFPTTSESFVISAGSAILRVVRRLTATSATYSIDTPPIQVVVVYRLSGQSISFAIAGNTTNVRYHRQMIASATTFALTGQTASLLRQFKVVATVANIAIATVPATLRFQRRLFATVQLFSIALYASNLRIQRLIRVDVRTSSLGFQETSLSYNRYIDAELGTYIISPYPAQFDLIQSNYIEDPYCARSQNFNRIPSPYLHRNGVITAQDRPYIDRPITALRPPKQC